jgi:hypothetical protein
MPLSELGLTKIAIIFLGPNGDVTVRADIIKLQDMERLVKLLNELRVG